MRMSAYDPNPNPYAMQPAPLPPLSVAEEKQWATLTHVLSIFFGIVAAAVFYFLYRNRGPFIRAHTTTEWNFQLTMLFVSFIGFVLAFSSVLSSLGSAGSSNGTGLFFVGYFLILVARVVGAILGIVASVAANKGNYFTYPAITFVK